MTSPAITSFAQDDNFNLHTYLNDDGLRTFCLAHNARAVGQLVRSRLLTARDSIPYAPDTAMPWHLYMGTLDPPWSLLGSYINQTVLTTYGVVSTDLSTARYEEDLSTIGPICFTVDCENSREEFQTCL